MVSALPDEAGETLRREGHVTLLRLARRIDGAPVILKVLDTRFCEPGELDRLRHELELGATLPGAPILRPVALEVRDGLPALLLEDYGGVPLDARGGPTPVDEFLPLAVRIAAAVEELHRAGVVHKALTPASLFVHPATREVRLGDLGSAARMTRELQGGAPPSRIEGALPYLSPEQTGRSSRAVDARSDLYALGVVFYQQLTGRLPFEGRDALDWIHQHLTVVPESPARSVPGLPVPVAAIVLRLLAKSPQARYQTARGLRRDLERCLAQWTARRAIEPFALGEEDVSDRLRSPQELHGREREATALQQALAEVVATGAPALALVAGAAGSGKSSLVQTLHAPLARERGLFLSGKFDADRRASPYSVLVEAFREAVEGVLAEGDDVVADWRRRLGEALGDDVRLLVELVPRLALVVGPQAPPPELGAVEAERRFGEALLGFVGALTGPGRPLVLFLDDLQWADGASLALLPRLAQRPRAGRVLVVGAYRDGEVPPDHPLREAVEEARRAGARVREVVLYPLAPEDLTALVADMLGCDREAARPLAAVVRAKTGGNPYFAIELLSRLHADGLVRHDPAAATWRWDLDRIAAAGLTENVVDLLAGSVARLPPRAREALEIAACVGHAFDAATLAGLCGRAPAELERELVPCLEEGLLARTGAGFRFAHDRVRQAARELLGADARAATHLRVARQMLARLSPEELELAAFDVVAHLELAASRVEDGAERRRAAELCLVAARRARAAHAYASASAYLASGERWLGATDGPRRGSLAYSMALLRAECELLAGDPGAAAQHAARAEGSASDPLERLAAIVVAQQAELVQGRVAEAVASGDRALALVGIELPAHPSWRDVLAERDRVDRLLGGRPVEAILELPAMADRAREAALRVVAPSSLLDVNRYCVHVARMVALSLEHGNASSSALWYGSHGFALAACFEAFGEADRFARAALALARRRGGWAQEGRAQFFLAATAFWARTVDDAVAHASAGHRASVDAGDLVTAGYLAVMRLLGLLARGDPLDRVVGEADEAIAFLGRARFRDMEDLARCWRQLARSAQGKTRALGELGDGDFDEARFEAELGPGRLSTLVCMYWIVKLRAAVLAGDPGSALAAVERARPVLFAAAPQIAMRDFRLHHALALAMSLDAGRPPADARPEERLEAMEEHRRAFERWAAVNPRAFRHQLALVSAEVARCRGDDAEAERLFEESVRLAREAALVQDEALAYERAAAFHAARGTQAFAELYLREARSCYLRWGAVGKVRQLEGLHPALRRGAGAPPAPGRIAASPEEVDLQAVVRASQAISGEVQPEEVARRLLEVAMAHGGAGRGLLFLERGGAPAVEAEARVEGGGVQVRMLERAPAPASRLAAAVAQYVWRTGERVLLDAAEGRRLFPGAVAPDAPWPQSAVGLPVVRRSGPVGVLYLENGEVPGAFGPGRLVALELLASQAAISLETARTLRAERAARAEAERARGRFAFLAEAGELLSRSIDYEETLERLGRLCARTMGEWCVIDVVEEGKIRRVAGAHADGQKELLVRRLLQRHPPRWDAPHPSAQCLREGRALLYPEVADEELPVLCDGEEHAALVRQLGCRSALVVPLLARGATLGALSLVSGTAGRYGPADLELAQDVARRAAVAIDNARLHRAAEQAGAELARANASLEREMTERQQAEATLRQAQKMESVGLLAGGIAHDFNNLLTPIIGNAELFLDGLASDDLRRPLAADVVEAARRARELTRQLLAFGRKQLLELKPIHPGELVARFVRILRRTIREDIRIETVLDPELPAVMADAGQLEQVLLNLALNARDAIRRDGVLTLEAHDETLGPDDAAALPGAKPGRHVVLSVRDTGVGMDAETLGHLFEPFFTTKERGKGTGLGLATAYGIVRQHGGAMAVESARGRGTTVRVHLPAAPGGAGAPAAAPEEEAVHPGRGETILVVEDDRMVRATACQMLWRLGYHVLSAEDPRESLRLAERHAGPIDLLLADVVLPGMDGKEVFERIRAVRPALKVLFMSGYAGEALARQGLADGNPRFLQKPLSLAALGAEVRAALDAP